MAIEWSSTSICPRGTKANGFGPSGRSETMILRPSITSCSMPISTMWISRPEQLVIDGRKIMVSDLPEGPKPFALVPLGQIEVEDHAMAIRMVLRRHVLQIGELQLHELQRQEAEKPGRQPHLGRFRGQPRPFPWQIP